MTVVVAVAVLFPGVGSAAAEPIVAVLLSVAPVAVAVATATVMVRVTVALSARSPIAHVTVPAAFVQPADADTNVVPAGSRSLIATVDAFEGPLLRPVSV